MNNAPPIRPIKAAPVSLLSCWCPLMACVGRKVGEKARPSLGVGHAHGCHAVVAHDLRDHVEALRDDK
jgi:Zn-finger protein